MTLHLIRLCVGVDAPEELADWQRSRIVRRDGVPVVQSGTKRLPTRADELVDGGSLYWVIRGVVRIRQRLVAIEPAESEERGHYAALWLDPELVPTLPVSHRPFQGWRYLKPGDAPPDLSAAGASADGSLPAHLVAELRSLGLM